MTREVLVAVMDNLVGNGKVCLKKLVITIRGVAKTFNKVKNNNSALQDLLVRGPLYPLVGAWMSGNSNWHNLNDPILHLVAATTPSVQRMVFVNWFAYAKSIKQLPI